MVKRITINLNKNDDEKLSFLYKHFQIPNESETKRFRKLLVYVVERIRHASQDVKSSRQEEQVGLLEGWDCIFRFPIWRYHKPSKEWHRKVLCFNPKTREIVGTNEVDAEVCKRCNDLTGAARPPALLEPKKEVSKPTPKPEQVQRLCEDCKIDISKQPSNHKLCKKCWLKKFIGAKAPDDEDHGEGLPGSPMQIRKREAAKLHKKQSVLLSPEAFGEQRWQRVQARMSAAEHQTKEEIMQSAIEHGAELDHYFAEYDHRMKQQPKEDDTKLKHKMKGGGSPF